MVERLNAKVLQSLKKYALKGEDFLTVRDILLRSELEKTKASYYFGGDLFLKNINERYLSTDWKNVYRSAYMDFVVGCDAVLKMDCNASAEFNVFLDDDAKFVLDIRKGRCNIFLNHNCKASFELNITGIGEVFVSGCTQNGDGCLVRCSDKGEYHENFKVVNGKK